jgi:hypothetical protein
MHSVSARERRGRHVLQVSLICLALGITGGCGTLTPAAKDATKGTIRGAYEEIDGIDDALRDRVARKLLDSPAVQSAAHDLTGSLVTGAVDGLTTAEQEGKINAFVEAALVEIRKQGDASVGELLARFRTEMTPILRALVRELVSSTSAAFREAAARDLPVIASAIIESSLRAFAVAASTATDQMRAQAKAFAEQDLGPMVGVLSERAAREAIIGVREGIHEDLNLKDPQVREGMRDIGFGLAQGIAQGTPTSPFTTTFAISTFVLATLLLIAIGVVISLWTRARMSAEVIATLAQRLEGGPKSGASGGS